MTETARYALIAGGFLAVGLNLALLRHLPELVRSVAAWRVYLVGQIFFDLAAIYGIHHRLNQPLGWGAYLSAAAVTLTLVSLVLLDRAYRRNGRVPLPSGRRTP